MNLNKNEKLGTKLKHKFEFSTDRDVLKAEIKEKRESVLLNPTRARIFELISKRPCITPSHLSKICGCSVTTIEWHARKLQKHGYIIIQRYRKKVIYYLPDSLDPNDTDIFYVINQSMTSRDIYDHIKKRNGSSISEISAGAHVSYQSVRWHVRSFLNVGIINIVKDGRNQRIYLTNVFNQKMDGMRWRANQLRRNLLKKMKSEGIDFEVLPSKPYLLEVSLNIGEKHHLISIVLNPYITV